MANLDEGNGRADFDRLVEESFGILWALEPAMAVYLGRHEYDGLVPDWSAEGARRRFHELAELENGLRSCADLDAEGERDRQLLLAEFARVRFEWEELRIPQRHPMQWVYQLDPDLYMKRTYAPAEHRARITVGLLENAEAVVAQAEQRLDAVLPRTFVEWGIRAAEGLADLIADEVPSAFGDFEGVAEGPSILAELRSAAARSSGMLRGFAQWLEAERLPSSDDGYAIGRAGIERLLRVSEMLEMRFDELVAIAERDLAANLDAFRATAAEIDPELDAGEVYRRYVASAHAEPGGLVEQAEAMLEDLRTFLIDHDLITIPSEVRARTAPTPKHLRWAFAMMDTPGPYETAATEAYYYVTPVDPEWDAAQSEEWLQALNTFVLEGISIHEAYPGHYVHFLHYDHAPTEVSKRLASYAFTEGWAHYTEQMMWEQGYRSGDPRFRLAQLSEALVRNCRFVCSLRLHEGTMTVDDATAFFVENAFYPETAARPEAERGTFDPGYFSYTLGKLQILQLREDVAAAEGRNFSLKAFHDRLLSRGAPPVELMREIMLGPA